MHFPSDLYILSQHIISTSMKLWEKGNTTNKSIEKFTVGLDKEMDLLFAAQDLLGTIAHCIMLEKIGLLKSEELRILLPELKNILQQIRAGSFVIGEGMEDVHSQVEWMLTEKLGEIGKKIHSGRSRNDQVLVDLKLFSREALREIVEEVRQLFEILQQLSEAYQNQLLPGYTHTQLAMPSSFGLWFGAYAESLTDDLLFVHSAYSLANHNPLGSAAGYGSSFPLDRGFTTELLGFADLDYNVMYAQMNRGKLERTVSFALSTLAATLSRLANDVIWFMCQNMAFVSFPEELTTGSSIMPHKKNPDVWELIRGRCNRLQNLPTTFALMNNNLLSGYHRDFQLLKENYLPAFAELQSCFQMTCLMLQNIQIRENILEEKPYTYLFSVEEVNRLVIEGVPFREAYRQVALHIKEGNFHPSREIKHRHEGSIGRLCNDEIRQKMNQVLQSFPFEKVEKSLQKLENWG